MGPLLKLLVVSGDLFECSDGPWKDVENAEVVRLLVMDTELIVAVLLCEASLLVPGSCEFIVDTYRI